MSADTRKLIIVAAIGFAIGWHLRARAAAMKRTAEG